MFIQYYEIVTTFYNAKVNLQDKIFLLAKNRVFLKKTHRLLLKRRCVRIFIFAFLPKTGSDKLFNYHFYRFFFKRKVGFAVIFA